jgi:predicted DNA-binding ribbon-helix-helix protein
MVVAVAPRYKTSVYVDRELWGKLKDYARRRNIEVSKLIEELIKEGLIEDDLVEILGELVGEEYVELDFEPVKIGVEKISPIVREMRDERSNKLSRH